MILLSLLAAAGSAAGAAPEAVSRGGGAFGPHGLQPRGAGKDAVCNFCHTPNGTRPDGPQWMRDRGPESPFGKDSSGETASGSEHVSVACLACHDGSQAVDVAAVRPISAEAGLGFGASFADHPVGIAFSGFRPPGGEAATAGSRLQRDEIGGEARWWLDMEPVPNGIRDKTDVILYTQGEGAEARPFIECATCHDPHANPRGMFLRTAANRDGLCLACHGF